ncbi:hypothetical protein KAU11_01580 [Candidatus Babeliales bacterium]|nr:hypothetical protein [Candidatus Babeliales bacterium]
MVFQFPHNKFQVFVSVVLSFVVLGSAAWVFYARTWDQSRIIHRNVHKIASILADIDRSCAITEIQRTRVPVGFLTIKSFVGSEVGNINLAYPKKWRGPYVRDNPSIDGKILYEIVKLKEGYCVVPGIGAKLPNGLVVGKDIKLNRRVSIKELIAPGGGLHSRGTSLGTFLDFPIGDWKTSVHPEPKDFKGKFRRLIDDFNQAMVFTMNTWLGADDDIRGQLG